MQFHKPADEHKSETSTQKEGRIGPKSDLLTKEVLIQLYLDEHKSLAEIAKGYSVNPSTVRRRMAGFGIARREKQKGLEQFWSKRPSAKLNLEFLQKHYVELQFSAQDIAYVVGTSHSTVINALRKCGIEVPDPRNARRKALGILTVPRLTAEQIRSLYEDDGRSIAWICDNHHLGKRTVKSMLIEQGVMLRGPAEATRLELRHKNHEKLTREYLTAEYLVKKCSCEKIGRDNGMSAPTVRKRLEELGIPIRSKSEAIRQLHYQDRLTPVLLSDLYVIQRRSSIEIGKLLGIWPDTIIRYLKRYGLPVRPQGHEGNENSISLSKAQTLFRHDRYGEPTGECRFSEGKSPDPVADSEREEELSHLSEALEIIKATDPETFKAISLFSGLSVNESLGESVTNTEHDRSENLSIALEKLRSVFIRMRRTPKLS